MIPDVYCILLFDIRMNGLGERLSMNICSRFKKM